MDLLSISDIARMLQVSRQRAFTLIAEHTEFPAPILNAPRRRLWDRSAVETWATRWPRKVGRPPGSGQEEP